MKMLIIAASAILLSVLPADADSDSWAPWMPKPRPPLELDLGDKWHDGPIPYAMTGQWIDGVGYPVIIDFTS
jgi:hypothetical protein